MICPRWVYTRTQPIGIREVLEYLTAALSVPKSRGRIIEIGGAEIVTYGQMMTIYAEVRGLKRWMAPVPVLTPRLSSYWVNLVTPIPAVIARPLIEGLRSESVTHDQSARQLFPAIDPVGYRVSDVYNTFMGLGGERGWFGIHDPPIRQRRAGTSRWRDALPARPAA